jgi:hypothetical protein
MRSPLFRLVRGSRYWANSRHWNRGPVPTPPQTPSLRGPPASAPSTCSQRSRYRARNSMVIKRNYLVDLRIWISGWRGCLVPTITEGSTQHIQSSIATKKIVMSWQIGRTLTHRPVNLVDAAICISSQSPPSGQQTPPRPAALAASRVLWLEPRP